MTYLTDTAETKITPANPPELWGLVGNTPLIPITKLFADRLSSGVRIYAKAEWFNPSGSVKDRPAAAILGETWHRGLLDGGRTFLDSTSGNMGIAYATLGAVLGIPIELALPENASPERLSILRSLGARITLTDPLEGSEGAREVAVEMANAQPHRYYYADQYSNPANWQAHYNSTGPEIYKQTGAAVTHFVAGMGTTGTITGTGRYLKHRHSEIQIIGVQPDGPMHGLEGLKHLSSSSTPQIYDASVVDSVVGIATEAAYDMLRALARIEGLFVGVSAAAAVAAAYEIASQLTRGTVVVLLPDSGMKYLSQPLWSQE